MACNYLAPHLAPFVVSLRGTGYAGEIVFAVRADAAREVDFMRAHRVTADASPCDEAARAAVAAGHRRAPTAAVRASGRPEVALRFWTGSLNLARFGVYARWLRARPHVTHAWLLDARDVVFQAHPFAHFGDGADEPPPEGELHFFADSWHQHCDQEVKRCISREDCKDMHLRNGTVRTFQPNVCTGTVFGAAAQLLRFCEAAEVALAPMPSKPANLSCYRNDQPPLNHMIWRARLREIGTHSHSPYGGRVRLFDHFDAGGAAVTLNKYVRRRALSERVTPMCKQVGLLLRDTGRTRPAVPSLVKLLHARGTPRAPIAIVHKWAECQETYSTAYAILCSIRRGVRLGQLTFAQLESDECRPPVRVSPNAGVLSPAAAAAAVAAEEAASRSANTSHRHRYHNGHNLLVA